MLKDLFFFHIVLRYTNKFLYPFSILRIDSVFIKNTAQ